jgi:hypothetical protein
MVASPRQGCIPSASGSTSIDALAHQYLGVEKYPNRVPGEQRVICYVEPVKVHAQG